MSLILIGLSASVSPAASAATVRSPGSVTEFSLRDAALNAVAATSAHSVWGVGCTGCLTTGSHALTVHFNGTTWKRVPNPAPTSSALAGVAATSSHSAWAVGSTDNGKTVILHWNGTAWTHVASPKPGANGRLTAVAAASRHNAWAVGSTGTGKTLILHWNGITWKKVPSPAPGATGSLSGVAVTSRHNAWAVGDAFNRADNAARTLIEHWNGTAWKRVPSPSPAGNGAGLTGVAAVSAHRAWAVGCSGCGIGGFAESLIERWNGKAWKQVASPDPGGGGTFSNVAATSRHHAWAVGSYYSASGASLSVRTLIARWNGKAWKHVSSPSPGASAGLSGLAAATSTHTWAVGEYQTTAGSGATSHSLILRGKGAAWTRPARAVAERSVQASRARAGLVSCLRRREVTPANHVVSCAGANVSWRHVTWSHWTAKSASGKGKLIRNDCTPTCAKGHFATYPATVRLSRPRSTKKFGRVFSKARFSYSMKGARTTAKYGLLGPVHSKPKLVPLQTPMNGEFFSPLRGPGLNCEINIASPPREVLCETFTPAESVTLSGNGTVKKCAGPTAEQHCLGDPGENTPTLHYGKATGVGRFRCLSTHSGMVCTVSSGKGFVISASSITRIRGY